MLSTSSAPCQVNVTKSCDKLGITIPQYAQTGFAAGIVIRLTIASESGKASFLALNAPWITIPTRICTNMDLTYGQTVSILELKTIPPHTRQPFTIQGDMVDMLSLVPATSSNGYTMYVDEYETGGEHWLRIWYPHPRGAARQIELRRYVDAAKLGQLLGLLQAEGDKRSSRVGFKNSAIAEHADLVSGLLELGVPLTFIHGRCIFNPNKSSVEAAREYSERYRDATGIEIRHIDSVAAMKGAIAADTLVRSSTLASILLSAMNEVRQGAFPNEPLQRNFLAKLLSGDGSLDARRTPRRLDVRLTIVDRDIGALRDYAQLLSQEGFKAKVIDVRITVRAYCTWLNLIRLYEIGAFRNSRNWIKLLCAIMITTQGRENRGYKRIQELSERIVFTSDDITARYAVGRRAANLWINTMHRKGMIEPAATVGAKRCKNYQVTARGKEVARILGEAERSYDDISKQMGIGDAHCILEQLKFKRKTKEKEVNQKELFRRQLASKSLN